MFEKIHTSTIEKISKIPLFGKRVAGRLWYQRELADVQKCPRCKNVMPYMFLEEHSSSFDFWDNEEDRKWDEVIEEN